MRVGRLNLYTFYKPTTGPKYMYDYSIIVCHQGPNFFNTSGSNEMEV